MQNTYLVVVPQPLTPSLTASPLSDRLSNTPEKLEPSSKPHPLLGRVGQPDDIASAVRFLLSEEAAWTTGQTIRVNGGMSTLRMRWA